MDWENVNFQFGNILRKHRESRHLTQGKFAELCNIDPTYYGRIERGEHSATLETCQKISVSLELTLSSLFNDII